MTLQQPGEQFSCQERRDNLLALFETIAERFGEPTDPRKLFNVNVLLNGGYVIASATGNGRVVAVAIAEAIRVLELLELQPQDYVRVELRGMGRL